MRASLLLPISLTGILALLPACGGTEPVPQPPPPAAPAATETASTPPAPAPPPAETAVTVEADSPMTTPSGATYTAPKGWTVVTRGSVTHLRDPNKDVSFTFVERREPDGAAAIAAAWKQVSPDFARAIRLATTPPARRGWDAVATASYETTTEEARSVWATARRKGDVWYVTLFDGSEEGWGRRWPGAQIASASFRAKGVEEESFRGKTAHVLDEARLKAFETFLEEGRKAAKVSGLAVAIVQGGKVVFEKGLGVRQLGKKDPVTPNTLFRIASMTKPLTSLMVATLVDDRKLAWDTPVTQLFPSFAVGDADLTKRMTMQNILCACTGIP